MFLDLLGELKYTPPKKNNIDTQKKHVWKGDTSYKPSRIQVSMLKGVYFPTACFLFRSSTRKVLLCWDVDSAPCILHLFMWTNCEFVWGCGHSTSRSCFINLHVGSHCVQYWYGIPRIYIFHHYVKQVWKPPNSRVKPSGWFIIGFYLTYLLLLNVFVFSFLWFFLASHFFENLWKIPWFATCPRFFFGGKTVHPPKTSGWTIRMLGMAIFSFTRSKVGPKPSYK